mmetsp:Transcript_99884/g.278138  ORF Transcript_99884/g.278138 Transcript_99884/m.278138 type:complete len:215 (-) Transcript_99884:458-1102(-)
MRRGLRAPARLGPQAAVGRREGSVCAGHSMATGRALAGAALRSREPCPRLPAGMPRHARGSADRSRARAEGPRPVPLAGAGLQAQVRSQHPLPRLRWRSRCGDPSRLSIGADAGLQGLGSWGGCPGGGRRCRELWTVLAAGLGYARVHERLCVLPARRARCSARRLHGARPPDPRLRSTRLPAGRCKAALPQCARALVDTSGGHQGVPRPRQQR